jgi:hypothetical protein
MADRDQRRWLLKRQTSGLNVVMGPDGRFNGVNPGEQVWVVPESQLAGAVEALHEALDAARTFNRGGMTWLEYDALLTRLASQHPRQ